MTTNTDEKFTIADKALTVLAFGMVVAGVVGYYYFADQSVLVRAPMVAGGLILGLLVFYQSAVGKRLWKFIQASRTEIRKVVWPTRQEAMQTTIAVIVFTLIFGIFFWGLDLILGLGVRSIQGV